VTDSQAGDVRELVKSTGSHSRLLDEAVVDAADLLASAGIDTRVLGGTAVSRLDYGTRSMRTHAVAELLIPDDQLTRAHMVLAAGEYRGRLASARNTRATSEPARYAAPNGSQITILTRPAWLTGDTGDLWARSETFHVNGRELRTVGREERLLDTCSRAAAADHDLGVKRDLAEAALHARLDAQRLVRLAETWKVDDTLATTVHAAWLDLQIADVVALSAWARSPRHHDRERGGSGRSVQPGIPRPRSLLARAFDFVPGLMR
jgi:hypothetical protein